LTRVPSRQATVDGPTTSLILLSCVCVLLSFPHAAEEMRSCRPPVLPPPACPIAEACTATTILRNPVLLHLPCHTAISTNASGCSSSSSSFPGRPSEHLAFESDFAPVVGVGEVERRRPGSAATAYLHAGAPLPLTGAETPTVVLEFTATSATEVRRLLQMHTAAATKAGHRCYKSRSLVLQSPRRYPLLKANWTFCVHNASTQFRPQLYSRQF
jgi:hypothetical protein